MDAQMSRSGETDRETHRVPGRGQVLLTGATGFVGSHLRVALDAAGYTVVCGTRDPDAHWVAIDVMEPASIEAALEGCTGAFYLVHAMGQNADDYAESEARAATHFAEQAHARGLDRLVYLGGVAPRGEGSKHLRSRLRTGEILREGHVPAFEIRAAMIIGAGGSSWYICRDLARRLPAMVLPKWLQNHSWPVDVLDVCAALLACLELPADMAGWYDAPGPERITHRALLQRIAKRLGQHPAMLDVPLLSPRLSSYWIALVTRAKLDLARELVEGLRTDLDPSGTVIWDALNHHERIGVDRAIADALEDEHADSIPSPRRRRALRELGQAHAAAFCRADDEGSAPVEPRRGALA